MFNIINSETIFPPSGTNLTKIYEEKRIFRKKYNFSCKIGKWASKFCSYLCIR